MKSRIFTALACALACLTVLAYCRSAAGPSGGQALSGSSSETAKSGGTAASETTVAVKTVLTNTVQNRVKIQTALPKFSGFPGAEALNRRIAGRARNAAAGLEKPAKAAASGETLSYSEFFDYADRGGQLSVWVTWQSYSGGSHPNSGVDAWNVETAGGKPCGTPDSLFRDRAGGGKWLTAQIVRKIREQKDSYFPGAAGTVEKKNGAYTYYLDGDTLVVVFGGGEIAPASSGLPAFAFPLKEMAVNFPLAVRLSGQNSRGAVRVNGRDALMTHQPASDGQGGYLLPLEDTCALLGLTLVRKDGGYSAGGRAVVPTVMRNAPYAPLSFFTDTLGQLVFYDGSVLRIFPKSA